MPLTETQLQDIYATLDASTIVALREFKGAYTAGFDAGEWRRLRFYRWLYRTHRIGR
jgi:hypothetical protein